jgi:hypothetical protein
MLKGIINKAKTSEGPGGEEWNARESLVKKFRPANILAAADAYHMINDGSMKNHEYPAMLFEELAALEVAYADTTAKIT